MIKYALLQRLLCVNVCAQLPVGPNLHLVLMSLKVSDFPGPGGPLCSSVPAPQRLKGLSSCWVSKTRSQEQTLCLVLIGQRPQPNYQVMCVSCRPAPVSLCWSQYSKAHLKKTSSRPELLFHMTRML